MGETNKTKKKKQAKHISTSEENLGALPKNYKKQIPERVLYLWPDGSWGVELTHGPSLGKGKSWRISEVRPSSPTKPVFLVQYPPRRNGSGLLQKNVSRNRSRKNGRIGKR